MDIQFTGKRALVTGATKGIGKDIVGQLVKCGAEVIAVGRNKDDLGIGKDITSQLLDCGAQVIAVGRSKKDLDALIKELPSVIPVQADLSNWSETESAMRNVGNIDLLVNNAGVGVLSPLDKVTEAEFDRVYNVNVKGLLHVTQIATNNMMKRKAPGAIVNISSQAGKAGLLYHTVYCSSKAAVDGFTRAAALEFGPHNIRVNAVNPTVIMTDMGKYFWSDPKVAKPMKDKIPLGRFAEVREVTDAVLYLLSDKASMITGVSLPIDGGFTAT